MTIDVLLQIPISLHFIDIHIHCRHFLTSEARDMKGEDLDCVTWSEDRCGNREDQTKCKEKELHCCSPVALTGEAIHLLAEHGSFPPLLT